MIRDMLLFMKESPTLSPLYQIAKKKYLKARNSGRSRIDVLSEFPLFRARSGGSYRMRAPVVLQTINDLVPSMLAFAESQGYERLKTLTDEEFFVGLGGGDKEKLAMLFNKHGSDKARVHQYYLVYAAILRDLGEVMPLNIFEVGLGTNMLDIVSNMGISGRPGASLRAFKDFLPNAQIFGADIDRRILFSEDRITTYFVDQTNRQSFDSLGDQLPIKFDMMIDDGLHSPNANLNSLRFFLGRINNGGYAIIEDISPIAIEFWQLISWMLPKNVKPWIIVSGSSLMFVVKKTA